MDIIHKVAILGLLGFFSYLVFKEHYSLVEPSGIEPLTSCVQSRRSPS